MTDMEVDYILDSLSEVVMHHKTWGKDYVFDSHLGDYETQGKHRFKLDLVESFKAGNIT
jgi:hypothetical protein